MHLVGGDVDDGSGPGCVRVAVNGCLQSSLLDEHHLFVLMRVCRMGHLARRKSRDVQIERTAGVRLAVKHLPAFAMGLGVRFYRQLVELIYLGWEYVIFSRHQRRQQQAQLST